MVITNLEDFTISQLYRPYCKEITGYAYNTNEYRRQTARDIKELRQCPNYIIGMLEKKPEAKALVFQRLAEIGHASALAWYWAIDYDRLEICRYIEDNVSLFGYTMREPVHKGF